MNSQQFVEYLDQLLTQIGQQIAAFVPQLIGALVYIGIGVLLAHLVRTILTRMINNLDRVMPGGTTRVKIKEFIDEKRMGRIIGAIVYWTILVFFITLATETLGLPVVTTWLSELAGYLPRIIAAVTIVTAGLIAGAVLRDLLMTASGGMPYGLIVSKLVHISIVLLSILLGIGQLGIDISLVTNLILLIAGAFLFSGALAFGIGAGTSVSNILATHYLRKTYAVGQLVRIENQQGRIIEMTSGAVILESVDGRIVIPAKTFSTSTAVTVTQEQTHAER